MKNGSTVVAYLSQKKFTINAIRYAYIQNDINKLQQIATTKTTK